MSDLVWLAADFAFPVTYSIRAPGSSLSSAMALPAPGPGTVRLTLIRAGFEISEELYISKTIFPILANSEIMISCPRQIGVSRQVLKIYKYSKQRDKLVESISYREYCHTDGIMTVYIKTPNSFISTLTKLFKLIGCWGKVESLTTCALIEEREPKLNECIQLIENLHSYNLRDYFSCFLSDLKKGVTWKKVIENRNDSITLSLFAWPLTICERGK